MSKYTWVVLNQSQSPSFQKLIGQLTHSLGPCLLITGMPHPNSEAQLTVEEGPSYDRTNMRTRLRSWMAFMSYVSKRVLSIPGAPFVLTVTNPPMLPHLGLLLTKFRGWRSGILVWDLYPEHVIEQGWLKATNPLVRTWSLANRRAYRAASVVITLGEGMALAVRKQARQDLQVWEIPNWADTELLCPLDKKDNTFAQNHCSAGAITVLYSGNLGASHSLHALLLAAQKLSHVPDLEFLIVGEGLRATEILEESERLGLTNLKLLPYQPWKILPLSLAVGDIAVVSQEPGTEHLSVPSKTYSALAVGSAILALTSSNSDLGKLVRKHDVGSVCNSESVSEISTAIMKYVNNRTILKETSKRARRTAELHYSEAVIQSQFLSAIGPHVS